jgi:hypothetical protein
MKKYQHPYIELENSEMWEKVAKSIQDLIENQDLVLQTRKEYVIGYICKSIQYYKV